LRFARTRRSAILAARVKSRAALLSLAVLPLLLHFAAVSAFSQVTPPEPDPLARIRAQPPAQVCSEAEPTLCAEAAPKIIANAMSSDSSIEPNLRQLASGEGGHTMGAPAPQSVVDDARTVDWAVAAFRSAGLEVHREPSSGDIAGLQNVVAEIRGREKPDQIVILATSIDPSQLKSHPEDATDAAVLFEAARDIAVTGLVPRRTIRFVLFFDDGINSCSASEYVNQHGGELDRTIGLIFGAQVTGQGTRYLLNGRHDIEPQMREALKPLESLALGADSFDEVLGPCTMAFLVQGVPTVFAEGERRDTRVSPLALDQMDFQELKRHAAIAGVTAFDISEDETPLGPRLSKAEAEALIKQTGSQ
jgi:hypothetical protein